MSQHEFLNLPIPEIEQYSLIIPIQEVPYWNQRGWKTYHDIGMSEAQADAWMLYGQLDKQTHMLLFNKPESICEVQPHSLIGRKITAIKTNVGTYGMGGPGYMGLLLDDHQYLVYTVWSADRYVHFSDTKDIIGAVITDFKLGRNTLEIHLNNQSSVVYNFHIDYVFDEEATEPKPNDISKYLYFKLKQAHFIV